MIGAMQRRYRLGLEVRLGAIGWAVYDPTPAGANANAILGLGSFCFDIPEDEKGRSTFALRGGFRRARRMLRRKRWRLRETRELCRRLGLFDDANDPKPAPYQSPWTLRAAGMERRLAPREWAAVLAHLAKRRGFFANRKSDVGMAEAADSGRAGGANAPPEEARMLAGMAALSDRLAGRTLGQMMESDAEFQGPLGRKRNRQDDYARTVRRGDVEYEAAALFRAQARFGNPQATEGIEAEFRRIAFFQFPLASSLAKVGRCRFEPGERRAALAAPSAERVRMLSRLNVLRIRGAAGTLRRLEPGERAAVAAVFGAHKTMTWRALRRVIGLEAGARFAGLNYGAVDRKAGLVIDPEARVFAHALGTATLREVIDGAPPFVCDRVAEIMSFCEGLEEINAAFAALNLSRPHVAALTTAVAAGRFQGFRGAAHISAHAARQLLPHLQAGLSYSAACARAGYDDQAFDDNRLSDIRNPNVRRVLRRALKQVGAVVRQWGEPAAVHIRMSRDLDAPLWERRQTADRLEVRTALRARHRAELAELVGCAVEALSGREMVRYELWLDQKGRCLYTDAAITPAALRDGGDVEVDYILPLARSQDGSYANKVLAAVKANHDKGERTPYEWLGGNPTAWAAFLARAEAADLSRGKLRRLLDDDFAAHEGEYAARQITDTRYLARLLQGALAKRVRKVVMRSAHIVGPIRRGWGLERALSDAQSEGPPDDRRHAVNALALAMIDEDILARAAFWYQQRISPGLRRRSADERSPALPAPPPWPDAAALARDVVAARDRIVVARAEIRRKTGQLHGATRYAWEIRRGPDGHGKEVQYERRAVWDLDVDDLPRLKDAAHNLASTGAPVAAWLARAPKSASARRKFWDTDPPRTPTPTAGGVGPAIRHVRLVRPTTAGIKIRRGSTDNHSHYDNSTIVRVDVFQRQGRFYYVPVYIHQLTAAAAPDRAIAANKADDWPRMDGTYAFHCTLYPNSYLEIVAPDGRVLEGYYRGIDRGTGALLLSLAHSRPAVQRIGGRRLQSLRKFTIDVLGVKRPAPPEPRTWHGVACT